MTVPSPCKGPVVPEARVSEKRLEPAMNSKNFTFHATKARMGLRNIRVWSKLQGECNKVGLCVLEGVDSCDLYVRDEKIFELIITKIWIIYLLI